MDMENRFEFCCSDFDVVRSTSECDRLTCDGKHNPVFTILFPKSSNEYCYCLSRVQLGQYWQCVCENQKLICPKKCNIFDTFNKCMLCQEVSDIYEELRKNYFFYPNESKSTDKPFQPIRWHIFTATNNSKFRIEIAKSVPYVGFPHYEKNSKLYTWVDEKWVDM